MSDPSLSDIDFKNKIALVWTTLKISFQIKYFTFHDYFLTKDHSLLHGHLELSPDCSGLFRSLNKLLR